MKEAMFWAVVMGAMFVLAPVVTYLLRKLSYQRQLRSAMISRPGKNPPHAGTVPHVSQRMQAEIDRACAETRIQIGIMNQHRQ